MRSNPHLEQKLIESVKAGLIVPRTERNPYLKCSYRGVGKLISEKWNVKIYTSGAVVCNDEKTLSDLENDNIKIPDKSLSVLQLDDSGWGFPLLGVMVGLTDGKEVWTDVVPVQYFQDPLFESRAYLKEYAKRGYDLLQHIGADPSRHRVEICTGFINTVLKDILRDVGFDVRVVEVKGLLQDKLENLFKKYVKEMLGKDFGYDPKELTKAQISQRYYEILDWGKRHTPELLKSGWKSMRNI